MIKKDYELIAKTLSAHFGARDISYAQEICLSLGLAFEKDNPRFDLTKFLKACEE